MKYFNAFQWLAFLIGAPWLFEWCYVTNFPGAPLVLTVGVVAFVFLFITAVNALGEVF